MVYIFLYITDDKKHPDIESTFSANCVKNIFMKPLLYNIRRMEPEVDILQNRLHWYRVMSCRYLSLCHI